MSSLEDAWRRWYPIAREKALRVLDCPGDAEDVAQEAFVRLWRTGMVEAEPWRASAWLYRTATRLSIDRLRESRPLEGLAALERAPAETDPADRQVALRQELRQLAAAVPEEELEVAILHRVDRLDQPEVAKVVGISERSVRRLLGRLDRRLERLRRGEER